LGDDGLMPATIPASTKTSLQQRLTAHAQERWPALAEVQVRFRGRFAYVDGELESGEVLAAQLTAFYRFLLDHGRRGGGGLAAKTVRNIHGELHAALRDAVRWGHVARNVAASADLPKGMAPEMHVWSPEQLRSFLDRAREDRLYAAWLLYATTGMRRGEVAGLRWPDVDLDAGRVSPRRPRVVVNYEVHVSEPKTAKGSALPRPRSGHGGGPAPAPRPPGRGASRPGAALA
jgi:integrase